jgi:hypothetical protein
MAMRIVDRIVGTEFADAGPTARRRRGRTASYGTRTPLLNRRRQRPHSLATTVIAAVCAFALPCAFATLPAQAPPPPAPSASSLARWIERDTGKLLAHADERVRAEAALTMAPDPQCEATLLSLAAAGDEHVHRAAAVALGRLGTPRAIQWLHEQLRDETVRQSERGPVLGFALGAAPPAAASSATADVLTRLCRGNWRRQRDTLLAMLLAMTTTPARHEPAALRFVLEAPANRDDEVRALLLHLLLPLDGGLSPRHVDRALDADGERQQLAVLEWLALAPAAAFEPWVSAVERIAHRGASDRHRAAAQTALARHGHSDALAAAQRTFAGDDPAASAAAMLTVLSLGGTSAVADVERQLRSDRNDARLAARLRRFPLSPSAALLERAATIASDARQPNELRATAALLVARGDGARAAPLLRETFGLVTDADLLSTLAHELILLGADTGLLPRGDAIVHRGALVAAGHTGTLRAVLQDLDHDAPAPLALAALATWRIARGPHAPNVLGITAPTPVRQLLLR